MYVGSLCGIALRVRSDWCRDAATGQATIGPIPDSRSKWCAFCANALHCPQCQLGCPPATARDTPVDDDEPLCFLRPPAPLGIPALRWHLVRGLPAGPDGLDTSNTMMLISSRLSGGTSAASIASSSPAVLGPGAPSSRGAVGPWSFPNQYTR